MASAAGPSAAVVEAEADPDEPLMALVDVARELQRKLRSPNTPPTAVAGLAREYRVTLAELERTAPRAKDGIDELLARRAARAASGA